jgi:hypothetical protein
MSKFVNGKVTPLVPPTEFKTKLLANTTLPAADKESLFKFQEEVAEFQRVVSGTARTLEELNTKLKYYFKVTNNTTKIPRELLAMIADLDQKLKELDRKLNGDKSLASRDFPTPPSIIGRIYTIVYGLWGSTSAPTQTQISSLRVAEKQFEAVYKDIRDIMQKDVVEIEKVLEESGAPWTPGRLPEWNK